VSEILKSVTLTDIRQHHCRDSKSTLVSTLAKDAHLESFISANLGKAFFWMETREFDDYNTWLPSFENQSFSKLLEQLPPEASWLDIGCGDAAVALRAGKLKHPQLDCVGVTYPVERTELPHLDEICLIREDGDAFLGRTHRAFELITAVQSIKYFPDQLATIKKAYRRLKPGGVLLVDWVANSSMPMLNEKAQMVNPKLLEKYLLNAGYDVEIAVKPRRSPVYDAYSLAIRKTHLTLKLPIRLVTVSAEIQRNTFDLHRLGSFLPNCRYVYLFDPKLVS